MSGPASLKTVEIHQSKSQVRLQKVDAATIERRVRQLLADKVSGNLLACGSGCQVQRHWAGYATASLKALNTLFISLYNVTENKAKSIFTTPSLLPTTRKESGN